MGHSDAVLALPVPFPLEAVSFLDAFPVDFEGDAVPPPLLEFALSLSMCGTAAAEAGLGFAIVLEMVLAGPMSVRADCPGEVNGSIWAETLLVPWSAWSVEPGEGPVLLVGRDKEALPVVDLLQPPKVDRDEPWVLGVVLERLGSRFVRLSVKLPVEVGDVAPARLRFLKVCLDPVDVRNLVQLRVYEGPEVFVSSCYGLA